MKEDERWCQGWLIPFGRLFVWRLYAKFYEILSSFMCFADFSEKRSTRYFQNIKSDELSISITNFINLDVNSRIVLTRVIKSFLENILSKTTNVNQNESNFHRRQITKEASIYFLNKNIFKHKRNFYQVFLFTNFIFNLSRFLGHQLATTWNSLSHWGWRRSNISSKSFVFGLFPSKNQKLRNIFRPCRLRVFKKLWKVQYLLKFN